MDASFPPKAIPGKRECYFPLWPDIVWPNHPDYGRFCCAPVAKPKRLADGTDQARSWCPAHLARVLDVKRRPIGFRKRAAPGPATANLIS